MTTPAPDELFEVEPPSADQVARRAIVLSVISCRGFVECDREHPQAAADFARDVREWLSSLALDGELTEWEHRLLDTPFGTLSDQDRADASWLSEAVAVFAWALGTRPEPGLEEPLDPAVESGRLGFLAPIEETILHAPSLRSADELAAYNKFIYTVHWRLRDFALHREPCDFRAVVRYAWGDPIHKFGLELKDDDLAVGGLPITQARDSDLRRLGSMVRERHRAANWLIGYVTSDFYAVPTDT